MDTSKAYKSEKILPKYKKGSWDGYVSPARTLEYIISKSKPTIKNKSTVSYDEEDAKAQSRVVFNPYQELLNLKIQKQDAEKRFKDKSKEAERMYDIRVADINKGIDDMQRQAQIVNENSVINGGQLLNDLQISQDLSKTTQQNFNAEYDNNKGNAEKFREYAKREAVNDRDNNIYDGKNANINSDIKALRNFKINGKKQSNNTKATKANTEIESISEFNKTFPTTFSWEEYLRSLGLSSDDIAIKTARANMKK